MARVKRGVAAHKRHKRLLKAAEGRRGTRSKLVKQAREALLHAMAYAYVGRKQRKRQLRSLLAQIGQLPAEDRPRVGALANPIRQELEAGIAARRERLEQIALEVRLGR